MTKDECDREFQITIATISSIGSRMENEIDDNLLLLTEKKSKIYLTEFLNKSRFIEKIVLRRKEKLDTSKPDSILLRKELENREDIKNILVLLNEFQIKAVVVDILLCDVQCIPVRKLTDVVHEPGDSHFQGGCVHFSLGHLKVGSFRAVGPEIAMLPSPKAVCLPMCSRPARLRSGRNSASLPS